MMGFDQWSKQSLLLVGLSCIVFGAVALTVISFTKPWVERPQIVAAGINKKVVIIGGIEEGKKTPAKERRYKDTAFAQEIAGGEIKIKKKIPTTISVREEPSANKVRKKSVKEIPQSHLIASDRVELERERGLIEASDPEEKSGGFTVNEEKRAERVEIKIAKKDVIKDERATSPVEASSPLIKFEPAITAQKFVGQSNKPDRSNDVKSTRTPNTYGAQSDLKGKTISVARLPVDRNSSIEVEKQFGPPKPPSLIATEKEVKQFFADYIERYTQKDIDGILSLFSPQAIQNQRDGFDKIKKIYSDFFEKSKELRYRMEDPRIEIYQNAVEVRGRYKLLQKGIKGRKEKVWKGKIRWILVRENGALKIQYLDYRHQ